MTVQVPPKSAAKKALTAMVSRNRTDWMRPLPQPLHILDGDKPILTLATVDDARIDR
jgi:hypothetical protein